MALSLQRPLAFFGLETTGVKTGRLLVAILVLFIWHSNEGHAQLIISHDGLTAYVKNVEDTGLTRISLSEAKRLTPGATLESFVIRARFLQSSKIAKSINWENDGGQALVYESQTPSTFESFDLFMRTCAGLQTELDSAHGNHKASIDTLIVPASLRPLDYNSDAQKIHSAIMSGLGLIHLAYDWILWEDHQGVQYPVTVRLELRLDTNNHWIAIHTPESMNAEVRKLTNDYEPIHLYMPK